MFFAMSIANCQIDYITKVPSRSSKTFADALIKIANEAKTQPDLLHYVPSTTQFGRMDEVKAARELVLCCWLPEGYDRDLVAE
jgi:glycine cleavage system protein P-like pyridoxal-binding family